MKTAILFCVILGTVVAKVLVSEGHDNPDQCLSNSVTIIDEALLHVLYQNLDNPQVGVQILCKWARTGLRKENGALDWDNIKDKSALSASDRAKLDDLVKECAVKKNTNIFNLFRQRWCRFFS